MVAGLPRWELHPGKKGGPAVGITKRGKGTKLMVVANGKGLPIGLLVASARPHELTLARAALETVGVPRPRGLVADKAYDSGNSGHGCGERGIKPTIPPIERRRGCPVRVGPGYRERWKVERLFAWLGQFRRLVVRHERLVEVFRGFVLVAFILICLRQF